MKINKLLLVVTFLFLFAGSMFAQEKVIKKTGNSVFSLDAEFRSRFEATPGIDPAGVSRAFLVPENSPGSKSIGQRARITAYYNNDKFETKFSFQDIRMFGQNKTVSKIWSSVNGAGLAVHEAWAMYKFINKEGHILGLKIGRQELNLADARLMWSKNWLHQAASYDAVKLQCRNENLGLNWDLGFSLNSIDYPGTATPFRTLGFFNATKKIGKNIKINVTDLYEGMENETVLTDGKQDSTYYRNTIGINPVVKFGDVSFNGALYLQTGKTRNLAGTYKGMMYTANLAYTYAKKYKVGFGYDNYSGREYGNTDDPTVNKAFVAPYAGAHKFFGCTDLHLKLFGKGYGITDINVKANLKLLKTTSLDLQFHAISFANNASFDAGTTMFKEVGNNLDFMIKHKFDKKVAVLVGYSLFMPSDNYTTMQLGAGVNAKTHNFVWVMFSFQPNLLKIVK